VLLSRADREALACFFAATWSGEAEIGLHVTELLCARLKPTAVGFTRLPATEPHLCAKRRWGFSLSRSNGGDNGMGNWLIERFTLFGRDVPQNWMILALAVILVGALIAWWRGQ
jgi:hypothetical protein